MKKNTRFFRFNSVSVLILTAFATAFLPQAAHAQLVLGQYEDEAPFQTWNTFGVASGAATARGGVRFALASDDSAALANPALLCKLPSLTLTLSGSYATATFFKYSVVNTGVIYAEKPLPLGLYAVDFAGASVSFKGWRAAVSSSIVENYDRPGVDVRYSYEGILYHKLNLRQKGLLRNINVSLARKIGWGLSAGLGVNFISGDFEKRLHEEWVQDGFTIQDVKSHAFKGFYINGGIVWDLTDRLTIAAVFRGPYTKKADSHSFLQYTPSKGGADIQIEASIQSRFEEPLVIGVGASYELFSNFWAASDISFFNWSAYKVHYFGEEMKRDFKDVVTGGAGFEYWGTMRLFNQNIKSVMRAGLAFDPQPMKDPHSRYIYLTFGSGIRWGHILLDAGAMFGSERGSGSDLSSKRFVVTIGYR